MPRILENMVELSEAQLIARVLHQGLAVLILVLFLCMVVEEYLDERKQKRKRSRSQGMQ